MAPISDNNFQQETGNDRTHAQAVVQETNQADRKPWAAFAYPYIGLLLLVFFVALSVLNGSVYLTETIACGSILFCLFCFRGMDFDMDNNPNTRPK